MSYAEGTVADGPNGQTAVFTGGKWVVQGSPQMPIRDTDQAALTKLGSDAQDAQWLAQKGDQFRGIQQGTGPGDVTGTGAQYHEYRIPLPVLDKVNLNPAAELGAALNPRIGDMESVTNQAWARMRPQGSGALRMPEIEGFQQSFPNIENSPQTNTDIDSRLRGDASVAAQKLAFVDNFMRSNKGTYADANAAWQAAQPGGQGVVFGQGAPVQGQPPTQGQAAYAQAAPPQPGAQQGSAGNPYYDWQGGQAPDGAMHVNQGGQLVQPGGQINMQPQPQGGAQQMQQPQPQGAPVQQPQAGPRIMTWNPQTGQIQ